MSGCMDGCVDGDKQEKQAAADGGAAGVRVGRN